MFVHANKKRSAKSFPREYYREKTKKVNTRAEGDDAASVFSDTTELDAAVFARRRAASAVPQPKRLLPSRVEEEDGVTSTFLPLRDEPAFKTPVESVRASMKGRSSATRSEAGAEKPAPSILPQGEVNFNVNFNRNRYKRPNVDPEYYDNKAYT